MKSTILKILVMLTLTTPAYAYRTFKLSGDNRDFHCGYRKAVIDSLISSKNFLPEMLKLNLSPECLTKGQKHFIETTSNQVRGIFFGTHGSLSEGVGVEGGLELVLLVHDRQTIMAGLVKYKGGGASVSLPIGASVTTGAIHGSCDSIEKYLGNFQNFSIIGINKSFGTSTNLKNLHLTKCDSSSNTNGLSLSLLGVSMTNYEAASEFVLLKGERVDELIDYIDRFHPIKG